MPGIDVRVAHPAYSAAHLSILAARDCYLGERAVKARADLYLPRLTGQKPEEYHAYKMRATFYSIVGRTVNALAGLAVQGDVAKSGNEETLKQMADAPHGMQLFEVTLQSVTELLLQGRYGLLVDAPNQAREVGLYGYVSDSIINWDVDGSGNYREVVLCEQIEVRDPSNRFKKTMEEQYRVLHIGNDGVYRVSIYGKDGYTVKNTIEPRFRGNTIDFIPFYTAMPDGVRAGVTKSPMEDMVNINMSHYRTSADLEHGRHFCGLPTPIVTGCDITSKLRIGGAQAWILPDKDAKASFLEFKGEGLGSLEKALKEKEEQLSSLSASIMSRSIRGSESPESIRLRMSSETASLFSVVKASQTLITKAYNVKSRLEGNPENIVLSFPTQFVSGQLTADEVQKYSKVYLEGGLSLDAYVTILRRGGALAADRSDNDEKAALKERKDAMDAAQRLASQRTQPTQ